MFFSDKIGTCGKAPVNTFLLFLPNPQHLKLSSHFSQSLWGADQWYSSCFFFRVCTVPTAPLAGTVNYIGSVSAGFWIDKQTRFVEEQKDQRRHKTSQPACSKLLILLMNGFLRGKWMLKSFSVT